MDIDSKYFKSNWSSWEEEEKKKKRKSRKKKYKSIRLLCSLEMLFAISLSSALEAKTIKPCKRDDTEC